MLRIGLTGSIGSGKTTVANYFADLGITIIDADKVAREIVTPNSEALQQIVEHFSEQALDAQSQLDRAKLRDIIFRNPEQRNWLERLLHPIIFKEMTIQAKKAHGPYCIYSIPLLIESSRFDFVDRILVVMANYEQCIARATKRDNITTYEATQILAAQVDDRDRMAHADDIIYNNDSLEELRAQVTTLHEKYLGLAKQA